MKIIDKKGRLFKLINIVDLLVIIAIILVIGGVFYVLSNSGAITVSPKEYYVATVKCEKVTQSVADNLNLDDKMVYNNTFVNGYILYNEVVPAQIEFINSDNQLILVEHPILLDMTVDIVIEVDQGANFILLGKYHVNIGKDLVVKTSRVEVDGIVIDLQVYKK
ncbi:MAG: DUF4330 domain-containing protein [Clostridiales bacterium]|nr:DUF4330 domain-containing protein [Clostridiales bacterium]